MFDEKDPGKARENAQPIGFREIDGRIESVYPDGVFADHQMSERSQARMLDVLHAENPDVEAIRRMIETVSLECRSIGGTVRAYMRRFESVDPDNGLLTHFHMGFASSEYDPQIVTSVYLCGLGYRLPGAHITLEMLARLPSNDGWSIMQGGPQFGDVHIKLNPDEQLTFDPGVLSKYSVRVSRPN